MEGIGLFGVLLVILGICITIAPLIIWRNTNRTNRLLALMLSQHGVKPERVRAAWSQSGSTLASIPGYENMGIVGALKDAGRAVQKIQKDFKEAASEDPKPAPIKPKSRYCHHCGSDAPLDAAACPNCRSAHGQLRDGRRADRARGKRGCSQADRGGLSQLTSALSPACTQNW